MTYLDVFFRFQLKPKVASKKWLSRIMVRVGLQTKWKLDNNCFEIFALHCFLPMNKTSGCNQNACVGEIFSIFSWQAQARGFSFDFLCASPVLKLVKCCFNKETWNVDLPLSKKWTSKKITCQYLKCCVACSPENNVSISTSSNHWKNKVCAKEKLHQNVIMKTKGVSMSVGSGHNHISSAVHAFAWEKCCWGSIPVRPFRTVLLWGCGIVSLFGKEDFVDIAELVEVASSRAL